MQAAHLSAFSHGIAKAPQPYLVVDEQVFKVHETLLDVLREDSVPRDAKGRC